MSGGGAKVGRAADLVGRITPDVLAVILWLVFVVASLLMHRDAIAQLTFSDPDNAMRLAQVRDLAAGQSWWDTTQHRVNPAGGGGLMHWSRFIDVQIVGLIGFLRLFLEPEAAERWALTLYPPLLVLPLLLVFARILRIIGDQLHVFTGLAIAASSITFLHFFAPLNIDHHNWQLLLSVALLWMALRPGRFSTGAAAAFIASIYVEISLEGLPFLAIFWTLFVLDWLRDPGKAARLAGFSAGLILFPLLWSLLFRAPIHVLRVHCDSFSWPYLVGVALTGAVFSIGLGGPSHWTALLSRRLVVAGIAGIAGVGGFALTGASCLAGPFAALEPLVRTYWYDLILEGQPFWQQDAVLAAIYLVPTVVGVAASIWACQRAWGRPDAENWARTGFVILCSTIMGVLVMRTMGVAHAYMVPAFAALAIGLWRWSRARRAAWKRVGSALLFLLAIPPVDVVLGVQLSSWVAEDRPGTPNGTGCPTAPMVGALAKQPPALLFAPIHIGPALLVGTPHSIVTTGHHRNHVAMNRVITAFLVSPDTARPLIRAEGAQYLVLCTRQTEVANAVAANPDGLAAHLLRGEPIAWLQHDRRLSSGTFHVYRIVDLANDD